MAFRRRRFWHRNRFLLATIKARSRARRERERFGEKQQTETGQTNPRPEIVPRRGYRSQPRVSTLGIVHQERRTLKGRQVERPNKAQAESDGPMVQL
jgi:hypothetical protein